MKILLTLFSALLLTGCAAMGNFSNFLFGENTTTTAEFCNAETDECIKIEMDGELTLAEIAALLAQLEARSQREAAEDG